MGASWVASEDAEGSTSRGKHMATYTTKDGGTVHSREREVPLEEVRQALHEGVAALEALPVGASEEQQAAALAKGRRADGLAQQYAEQHGLEVLL